MPSPSAPNFRERKILYKKPKNLSAKEKAVTYATVLNMFLIVMPRLFVPCLALSY